MDPDLRATVTHCRPLRYDEGADEHEDRPAHVRAASGAAWIGERIVVVQDDASFLALVEPDSGRTRSVSLPRGNRGRRLFDERRGTKRWKLDLESCAVVQSTFVAFGSGSTPERRRIALAPTNALSDARIVNADSLYELLELRRDFSGSELNIEGLAAMPDGRLRLFQRGNGAPGRGEMPVDATADLDVAELLFYLAEPEHRPPPSPRDVVRWSLGRLGAARLTFTDATWWSDRVLFVAAAEDSPDTYRDGVVTGAAIGVFAPDGATARWATLLREDGSPWIAKPEGIAPGRTPGTVLLVVDRDDPELAAELCEVRLDGSWAD